MLACQRPDGLTFGLTKSRSDAPPPLANSPRLPTYVRTCRRNGFEMDGNDRLGRFEEIVLLALVRLRENAYGVPIRREIAERTGRDVSFGAVYTTLERLDRKGYVSSRMGDPTPERGGRAKRYFRIEAPGIRALNETRETIANMGGLVHVG
jgi:PadR family transcriptional regulator, regulatory protein PadR